MSQKFDGEIILFIRAGIGFYPRTRIVVTLTTQKRSSESSSRPGKAADSFTIAPKSVSDSMGATTLSAPRERPISAIFWLAESGSPPAPELRLTRSSSGFYFSSSSLLFAATCLAAPKMSLAPEDAFVGFLWFYPDSAAAPSLYCPSSSLSSPASYSSPWLTNPMWSFRFFEFAASASSIMAQ